MDMIRGFWAMLTGTGRGSLDELAALLRDGIRRGDIALPLGGGGRSAYDRIIDALNRLPRPLMALGTVALLGAALVAPDWFAARMEALSAMPEALWWLIGAIISLYFGARHQAHVQAFQREIIGAVAPAEPAARPDAVPEAGPVAPRVADAGPDADLTETALAPRVNDALDAWQGTQA